MYENINFASYQHHPTLFLTFFLVRSTFGGLVLEGPNVCTFKEPYETVDGEVLSPRRNITTYVWCWDVPFLCPRTKSIEEQKNQTQMKWRLIEECCEGYMKHETQNLCIPVCLQNCSHGKCVAPNICEYEFGYEGVSCDKNLDTFEADSDFRPERLVDGRNETNWLNKDEVLLTVQILALLLVVVIATLLIYYCRKVAKLEAKLAEVQLAVLTKTSSGRRQFDNIAYIYGSESHIDTDGYCLMKGGKNYHARPKKCMGLKICTTSKAGKCRNSRDASGRSRTYLRIQDFREHQYAEIQELAGQEQYDQLNFIRPGTSPRPGYQKLVTPLEVKQLKSFKRTEAVRNVDTVPAQQRRLDILVNLE